MSKKMPKSSNGPRSLFSLLPFEMRFKIAAMIQDGFTANAIAGTPEIAEAYAAKGGAFNRAAMTRIKKSHEYKELAEKRAARQMAEREDALARAFLGENNTLENVAEQTKVELLRVVKDCISGAEDTKEVERLVRSAVALANTAKDDRIAELSRRLREAESQLEAARGEWTIREADYQRRIEELTAAKGAKTGGMTPETIAEVEEKIKLM